MEKEALLKEIQGLISDSQKENVSKKDLEARVEEINKALKAINDKPDNHEEVKALKTAVEKLTAEAVNQAAIIKALNEKPIKADDKPKNMKEALMAAIIDKSKDIPGLLVDKNDDNGQRKSLKDYFTEKGNKVTPVFTVKALVDMLESSIVGANVATVRLAELDSQRVGIPLTVYPHVLDWMPSKTMNRPTMSLLVVYEYEDGAGTKTEGSAPNKSSFKLKTVEFKSFYISTYFTLSDETLDDLEEAMSEISATAPDKIQDNVDSQILGTAGDDGSALAGLFTANKKTDFASATTYATSVAQASLVDVLEKMKLQARVNKYKADAVLLNASDISKLGGKKDQLDNSINDRRVVYNVIGEPVAICGMRVLESAITADTAAVLDSKQVMIGKRKDMTMEIGYNGTDFTEGQKTVILKFRLAFGVRDKAAVIYCPGLDAAITAINIA